MSLNKNNLDDENKQKLKDGIIVSKKQLIGYAIYEAIVCRSYAKIPVSIEYMIRDINIVCNKYFEKISDDYCYKSFDTVTDIEDFIKKELMSRDSFKQLNLSSYEFDNDISYDDTNRPNCGNKQLDDFIDLDAYARNLSYDLLVDSFDIDYSSFKRREVE